MRIENITSDQVESMDVDTFSQILQANNIVVHVYTTYVILEGELFSAEIKAAVVNNYGNLKFALNNVQNILKKYLPTKKYLLDLDPKDKVL